MLVFGNYHNSICPPNHMSAFLFVRSRSAAADTRHSRTQTMDFGPFLAPCRLHRQRHQTSLPVATRLQLSLASASRRVLASLMPFVVVFISQTRIEADFLRQAT